MQTRNLIITSRALYYMATNAPSEEGIHRNTI